MRYFNDITSEVLTWCHQIDQAVEEVIIKNGLLYNWPVIADARHITSFGWHIPTYYDFEALIGPLGGEAAAGGTLKETGTIYWSSPNTGATNITGFNGRGSGARESTFTYILEYLAIWGSTESDTDNANFLQIAYDSTDALYSFYTPKINGLSVRPVKNSTLLANGEIGSYLGNDGQLYETRCIGTQEWVSRNIAETKYRDGTIIPEVTNQATWNALTTGALCAYNNSWANV